MTTPETTNGNLKLEEARALLIEHQLKFSDDSYSQEVKRRFEIAGPEYFLADLLEIFDGDIKSEELAVIFAKTALKTGRSYFEPDHLHSANPYYAEAISRFIASDSSTPYVGHYLDEFIPYLRNKLSQTEESNTDSENLNRELLAVYRSFFQMLNKALAAKTGQDIHFDHGSASSTARLLSTPYRDCVHRVHHEVEDGDLRGTLSNLQKRVEQHEFDDKPGLKERIGELNKRCDAIPRKNRDDYSPMIFKPLITLSDEMIISDVEFLIDLIEDQLVYLEGFVNRNEGYKERVRLEAERACLEAGAEKRRAQEALDRKCDTLRESIRQLMSESDALVEEIITLRTAESEGYEKAKMASDIIGKLRADVFSAGVPFIRNEKYIDNVLILIDRAVSDLESVIRDKIPVEESKWREDKGEIAIQDGEGSDELIRKLNKSLADANRRKNYLSRVRDATLQQFNIWNNLLSNILSQIKQLRLETDALKRSGPKRWALASLLRDKVQTVANDIRENTR